MAVIPRDRIYRSTWAVCAASLACSPLACNPAPPEPAGNAASKSNPDKKSSADEAPPNAVETSAAPSPPPARPPATRRVSPDDPVNGEWSLADATAGLPAGKQIVATIETSLGKLECKLFDDKAPITVANFVGLARGLRPWKTPAGTWEKKPAYDGTVFHRVIKGFMIQGGDAKKNGTGEAGFVIPDEVWPGARHDRAGLLCMANRGPNTNSAQFFITDGAASHLDTGYTIFGECGPVDTVHRIASVETTGDRPTTPPDIKKIAITRK